MIIFLYGTDGYRINTQRDDIVAKYRAKHSSGLNFVILSGSDRDFRDRLEDSLKNVSFFQEVKLIMVSNIGADKTDLVHDLLHHFKVATDKNVVVLAIQNGPISEIKSKKLASLLSAKENLVREINLLQGVQLTNWIKREAEARGVSFEPAALRNFVALCGTDSWRCINELEKLANYSRGVITEKAVAAMVKTEVEPNIFNFIDALGARDGRRAFQLLSAEIASGRDPYYVLTMIVYQFRNMLIIKDILGRDSNAANIAKEAGLHPFVTRKLMSAVRQFSLDELRTIYGQLLDLELGSKNGIKDLEDNLYSFVLRT